MKKGLFAGTFYPPSLGHLNIIERAVRLCDKLYIAVIDNAQKASPLLPIQERIDLVKKIVPQNLSVEVISFNGLIVDFAKDNQINFFVRGFRTAADLDQELIMAGLNKQMSGIDTIFLQADPQYACLSSSMIREIASYGHRLHHLVPEVIEPAVFNKLKNDTDHDSKVGSR
jgi:pantetheine-phosphate adenylyltransferase